MTWWKVDLPKFTKAQESPIWQWEWSFSIWPITSHDAIPPCLLIIPISAAFSFVWKKRPLIKCFLNATLLFLFASNYLGSLANSWMLCTCIFQLMVFPLSLPALAWHCDDNNDEEEEDNDGDVDGMPDGASRQLNPVALASVSIDSSLPPNVLEAQQEGSQKVFIWSNLSWRTEGSYLPDKSRVWACLKQSAVLRNHSCLIEGLSGP